MKKVGFQYKIDSGGSFSVAKELRCTEVTNYLMPEYETDNSQTRASTGKICQKGTTRMKVMITISNEDLDTTTAAGRANLLFIQYWYSAPLKRIYNADTTNWPLLDGATTIGAYFNSSSNTNYVNVLSVEYDKYKMDVSGAGGRTVKQIKLELEAQNKYTITLIAS